jgi:hypothetical protein
MPYPFWTQKNALYGRFLELVGAEALFGPKSSQVQCKRLGIPS